VNYVLFTLANGILVLNLIALFVGARRPPYDHVAGTVVRPVGDTDQAVQLRPGNA
jgi:hypothetical protein